MCLHQGDASLVAFMVEPEPLEACLQPPVPLVLRGVRGQAERQQGQDRRVVVLQHAEATGRRLEHILVELALGAPKDAEHPRVKVKHVIAWHVLLGGFPPCHSPQPRAPEREGALRSEADAAAVQPRASEEERDEG